MTTPTIPRADSPAVSGTALTREWYRWASDLTALIQEQAAIIETLRARIAALESGG